MKEKTLTTEPGTHPLRIGATLISFLFHPIFLVPLMGAYLIYGLPSMYLGVKPDLKMMRLITIIANTVFFPLLCVLLSKGLGFIQSIKMEDQKDRIIPYIATLTCYFWAWMAFRSFPDTPPQLTAMLFGAFLAVSAGLTLNSFLKISMHAIGVGGLLTFMLLMVFTGVEGSGLYPTLAILITGLVCTARMMVSDHNNTELGLGFIVGILGQVIGYIAFAL